MYRFNECKIRLVRIFLRYVLCFVSFGAVVSSLEFTAEIPRKIRHNSEETLVIHALNADGGRNLAIAVEVKNNGIPTRVFYNKKIKRTISDDHHVLVIPFKVSPAFEECQPSHTSQPSDVLCTLKISVTITDGILVIWHEVVPVTVIKTPARIFIQTDRPVYSPEDEVYSRFISTDEELHSLNEEVLLSITSPGHNGVPLTSWRKTIKISNKPFVRKFKLPPNCPQGIWNITASYTRQMMTDVTFRLPFLVKYSRIPTFQVNLEHAKSDVILPYDDNFHLQVVAKTFHGVSVSGAVHVAFGLSISSESNTQKIAHVVTNRELVNGILSLVVPISKLVTGSISAAVLTRTRLVIEASVTESGSGLTEQVLDDSIQFASHPYVIEFLNKRQKFQTGATTPIHLKVSFVNGTVANGVDVELSIVSFIVSDGTKRLINEINAQTCYLGTIIVRLEPPENSEKISITAKVVYEADNGHQYVNSVTKVLYRQALPSEDYVYIEQPLMRLQVGVSAIIQVYAKRSASEYRIFFTTMKNGKVLSQHSVLMPASESSVLLHLPVTSEMSPSVLMKTYYISQAEGRLKIIQDQVLLQIENVCLGTEPAVTVNNWNDRNLLLPGSKVDLQITGEASSIISMVGYDEALISMRNYESGNSALPDRKETFRMQEELNDICSIDTQYIGADVKSSGEDCSDEIEKNRNRRSLLLDIARNNFLIETAGRYYSEVQDCCIVGTHDISDQFDNNTCELRKNALKRNRQCKEAFMFCCLIAECSRGGTATEMCIQRQEESFARSTSPGIKSLAPVVMEKSVGERRRHFFNPTWFFVDFTMESSGQKVLNSVSRPMLPRMPDRITKWNIDILSLSNLNGMCIGNSFKIPVQHLVYIDVQTPLDPVVIGSQVSVDITVYNHAQSEAEVRISMKKTKDLCFKANSDQNPNSFFKVLPSSINNTPTTFIARYILFPLLAKTFHIKLEMRATLPGLLKPIIDIVEKKISVISEGKKNTKTDWVLVDSKSSGYYLRDKRRSKKKIKIDLPDNAVPDSSKVKMSLFSLPSATFTTPVLENSQATVQDILYQLHPTISKFEYLVKIKSLTDELKEKFTKDIQQAYNDILGFSHQAVDDPFFIGNVSHRTYWFSYSPASTSSPSLLLTSTVTELLWRVIPVLNADMKVIRGSLYWIISHQDKSGYFRTSPINVRDKDSVKTISLRSNNHKSERLKMNNVDRKIYITSTILLDLHYIKTSIETFLASSRSNISFENSQDLAFDWGVVNDVLHHGKLYLVKKLIRKSLRIWTRRNLSNDTKWIETCIQQRFSTPDETIVKTNGVIATAHALSSAILQGFQGNAFANWLMYNRNSMGNWISLRATMAAMRALNQYNTASIQQSELHIEMNDFGYNSMTLHPADVSSENSNGSEIELDSARHEISVTIVGTGRAWIKVETSYYISNELSYGASRQKRAVTKSACPYEVQIKISSNIPITYFYPSVMPTRRMPGNFMCVEVISRAAAILAPLWHASAFLSPFAFAFLPRSSQPSRSAWQVLLTVDINEEYIDDPDYSSYVVEFGLPLGSEPIKQYLDNLFNSVEQIVDHYRTSKRSILFYMTGKKSISFQISEVQTLHEPIPVKIYPITAPELSCTKYYSIRDQPQRLVTFCSNTSTDRICVCAAGFACPSVQKPKKSAKVSVDKRIALTCRSRSTYAYKVLIKREEKTEHWYTYYGTVTHVFRKADGTAELDETKTHTFCMRTTCTTPLKTKKEYLVIGHVVHAASNGIYKHLLDSDSWLETWIPRSNGCRRLKAASLRPSCLKIEEYNYRMNVSGCPAS